MLSFALSMLSNALRVRWYDELRAGRERKWERMSGGRGEDEGSKPYGCILKSKQN